MRHSIEWRGYGVRHAWKEGSKEAVCGVYADERDSRINSGPMCPYCSETVERWFKSKETK